MGALHVDGEWRYSLFANGSYQSVHRWATSTNRGGVPARRRGSRAERNSISGLPRRWWSCEFRKGSLQPVKLAKRSEPLVRVLPMLRQGKVVGGRYVNGTVSIGYRGNLVVQAGLKRRTLTSDEVAEWEEINAQAGGDSGALGAVSKVVVGSVLPGTIGKMASAALDATHGSMARPPRTVRIEWTDGKQSLMRLPDQLFTHLALVLEDRQAAAHAAPQPDSVVVRPASNPDIAEQIGKLALLRDQGALTDEEFASKKAELLARL